MKDVVRLMVGREISEHYPRSAARPGRRCWKCHASEDATDLPWW